MRKIEENTMQKINENIMQKSVRVALLFAATLTCSAQVSTPPAGNFKFKSIDVPGAVSTDAEGINNLGQIAGSFRDSSGVTAGYVQDGDQIRKIQFPNATRTFGACINNSGTVGGNYFDGFATVATNTAGNKMIYRGTNKLSLTLNSPSFGLFKGSLVDPASQKTIAFKGAVLQTEQAASGLFVGTNQTGKVIFAP